MYCVKVLTRGKVIRLDGVPDPLRTPCTFTIPDNSLSSVKGILDSMCLIYKYVKMKEYDSDAKEQEESETRIKRRNPRSGLKKLPADDISFSGKISR